MDCLNVIWNSLCKPSGFKAVEASAKHYLPATREAPKIISRALQELHSQKNPGLSVCVLTSELEARKVSHARLKRAKNLTHALQKNHLPCLSTGLFVSSELHRASWITSARRIKPHATRPVRDKFWRASFYDFTSGSRLLEITLAPLAPLNWSPEDFSLPKKSYQCRKTKRKVK